MSTNKVYGDAPNELPLKELPLRWDYAREEDFDRNHGADAHRRVEALDIRCQQSGGRRDGPGVWAVLRHEDLLFALRLLDRSESFRRRVARIPLLPGEGPAPGGTYQIYGYKGKQVRDNIHSYDVATAIEAIYRNPRVPRSTISVVGGPIPARSSRRSRPWKQLTGQEDEIRSTVSSLAKEIISATSATSHAFKVTTRNGPSRVLSMTSSWRSSTHGATG